MVPVAGWKETQVSDMDFDTIMEKAYEEFQGTNKDTEMKFYCVGYTIIRYYLNGYQITNLQGHKAKKVGADLITTFLPDSISIISFDGNTLVFGAIK